MVRIGAVFRASGPAGQFVQLLGEFEPFGLSDFRYAFLFFKPNFAKGLSFFTCRI
jgi:hypothetical protein